MLTDAWLRAVKPPSKGRIEVRDAKAPGLVVRIRPSGLVSWAARGRRPDGREARITLGTWPALSLAEARKRALAARVDVADGKDPIAEKREKRAKARERAELPSVAEKLAEWQAANADCWSRRYASEVARLCHVELVPKLGFRLLREMGREDWTSVLAAKARQSRSVGAMLYRTVAAFLSHAEARGWITEHPLPRRGASQIAPPVKSRERVLTEDELRRVWAATASLRPGPRCFVRLLMTTGCRAGEAAEIALGELDPVAALWRLSGQRTKNGRAHVMPVPSALMADLMARAPEGAGETYRLLGRTRGGALSGFSKLKLALDAASGVTGWRFHDLRRTTRTKLAALGVAPDIVERCLNHVSAVGTLAEIYDRHDYETEIVTALARWQAALGVLVGETGAGADVVPLRRVG